MVTVPLENSSLSSCSSACSSSGMSASSRWLTLEARLMGVRRLEVEFELDVDEEDTDDAEDPRLGCNASGSALHANARGMS